MIVNATRMLKAAKDGHYAVGHFNTNNLEWTKAILLTAEELQSPVMLGVSEGANKYMTGYKVVADMVKAMIETLRKIGPKRIIYVSCNVDTFARDYIRLRNDYLISSKLYVFNMFPHTKHVESVVLLTLKNQKIQKRKCF